MSTKMSKVVDVQGEGFSPPFLPIGVLGANLFVQRRRGLVLLVVAQHLSLARVRPGLRGFGGLRQGLFHFRQILYAVARERNVLSRRRHTRHNVVAFSSQRILIRRKRFLLATKIAITNRQRARR